MLGLWLMFAWAVTAQDQPNVTPGTLTIEEVVTRAKAGISDELIIASIRRNTKPFDLNSDEIVALKHEGVSDAVIRYMLNPSLPYSPPPPPTPAAPGRPLPEDPLALKAPPENGIYYVTTNQDFVPLELKQVVPSKQPGKLASMLKIQGHVIGSIAGPSAKTRSRGESPIFYGRLGEKVAIDDLTILLFQKEKDRRDTDFGTKVGKPNFPPKAVRQFESKEVMPGLFRLSVQPLESGEYLFYILGSGDERKGLLGKGYAFGVN